MTKLFTQPAVKEKLKARVAIDGPTGSGKTWTALQAATILADGNPIGVIDTENRSAAYYAPAPDEAPERMNPWDPPYNFFHLPVEAPYDPRQLAQMVKLAGDELGPDGVLVIDSLTHYWNGEGGTLDIVDGASSRGNSFTGWKEGTPAQRNLLHTIVHARCHVIVTMRSKMEYVLVEHNKNGRTIQVPTKMGMQPEQRAGVEYEFTVVADMDLEHRLTVSKSRCDVIADDVKPSGRSAETWAAFSGWLNTGATLIGEHEALALVEQMNTIADDEERSHAKAEFVSAFGKPGHVTSDRLAAAQEWVTNRVAQLAADEPEPQSDSAPDADDGDELARAFEDIDGGSLLGDEQES